MIITSVLHLLVVPRVGEEDLEEAQGRTGNVWGAKQIGENSGVVFPSAYLQITK